MSTGQVVRISKKLFNYIEDVRIDITKKTGKAISFKDACDIWLDNNKVPNVSLKDIL